MAFAAAELGAKVLFRWRTWRDRGLIALGATAALAVFLCTEHAEPAARALAEFTNGAAGAALAAALALVCGLAGVSAILPALFVGFVHPSLALSLLITLPMAVGAAPQALFLACTMPPSGGRNPAA